MFDIITQTHHIEPWKAMCKCMDLHFVYSSCMSEYEIYFNFIFLQTNQVKIRTLKWADAFSLSKIEQYKKLGYHYVSCHTRI